LLRVGGRESGIRLYRTRPPAPPALDEAERFARLDALVDTLVNIYAPLPASSLSYYVRRLRYAAPQWQTHILQALARARQRLSSARIGDVEWFWPADENPRRARVLETVRLLAPFDPVVHDRTRFELFWGWQYRFEPYTPAAKRKLGYYALPLLWRDRVIGWANLALKNGSLTTQLGYIAGQPPRDAAFGRELEAELQRVRLFLPLLSTPPS
jgi:hypothetical protein